MTDSTAKLPRRLGLFDAVVMIVGNTIGAGIFLLQSAVAGQSGNGLSYIGFWLLGGLVALLGAFCMAELAGRHPQAGGDYVYLETYFGRFTGSLYGYAGLFLTYTGSIAAMAELTGRFQGGTIFGAGLAEKLFAAGPLEIFGYDLLAVGFVLVLTTVNYFGIKSSALLQRLITGTPVVLIVSFAVVILAGDKASGATLEANLFGDFGTSNFASAMIFVSWVYAGWNVIVYLAEDVKDPRRTIPRALFWGVGIVTGLYAVFALVALSVFSFNELRSAAGTDVVTKAWEVVAGPHSAMVVAAVIMSVVLGSINSTIAAGSRVYLAMARRRSLFKQASGLGNKNRAPGVALWLQAVWTCLLILIFPDVNTLVSYTSIVMIAFSIPIVLCLIPARKQNAGDGNDLFKLKFFPWPVIVYAGILLAILYFELTKG